MSIKNINVLWANKSDNGFDIVIGNPPYGYRTTLSKEEKKYFREDLDIDFKSGDSAELFLKISLNKLVNTNGILSFIIFLWGSLGRYSFKLLGKISIFIRIRHGEIF